jgi:hypothetical protein
MTSPTLLLGIAVSRLGDLGPEPGGVVRSAMERRLTVQYPESNFLDNKNARSDEW